MVHHFSYFDIVQELLAEIDGLTHERNWQYATHYRQQFKYHDIPFILDDARDNAIDGMRHVLQNYFWGVENIFNIGSAAGLSPNIKVGDYVFARRAIRANALDSNLATADEKVASDLTMTAALKSAFTEQSAVGLHEGDSWTVASMHYTWDELAKAKSQPDYKLLTLETEMAALCTMVNWVNHNYSNQLDRKMKIGNLFYISDLLPDNSDQPWIDTMNDARLLRPYKKQALKTAIMALKELPEV